MFKSYFCHAAIVLRGLNVTQSKRKSARSARDHVRYLLYEFSGVTLVDGLPACCTYRWQGYGPVIAVGNPLRSSARFWQYFGMVLLLFDKNWNLFIFLYVNCVSATLRLASCILCGAVPVWSLRHGDPYGKHFAFAAQSKRDVERNSRDCVSNLLYESSGGTLVDGLPAGCTSVNSQWIATTQTTATTLVYIEGLKADHENESRSNSRQTRPTNTQRSRFDDVPHMQTLYRPCTTVCGCYLPMFFVQKQNHTRPICGSWSWWHKTHCVYKFRFNACCSLHRFHWIRCADVHACMLLIC